MSGTGIDVPNLVTEVSGNGIDVVMNLPKCPVPAINTVGMYRRYASVCTVPNTPFCVVYAVQKVPFGLSSEKVNNKNVVSWNLKGDK